MNRRRLTLGDVPKRLFIEKPYALGLYPYIRQAFPYTQLKYAGLAQMYEVINNINEESIPGAIVEMGCGRGGNGAFMAKILEQKKVNRDIWLFDSFEGLSQPQEEDFMGTGKKSEKIRQGYLAVNEENVEEALRALSVQLRSNVHVIKGWFDQTVPKQKENIGDIAILRLDADLYEPTIFCLEQLYDQVVTGGYIVIDDYKNWVGARHAVYEFFCKRKIAPYIQIYPHGGVAYFRKVRSR